MPSEKNTELNVFGDGENIELDYANKLLQLYNLYDIFTYNDLTEVDVLEALIRQGLIDTEVVEIEYGES